MRFLIFSPLAVCQRSESARCVRISRKEHRKPESYLQTRTPLLLSTDRETKGPSKVTLFVWRSCIFRAFSDAKTDSGQLYYFGLKWFRKKTEALKRGRHDEFKWEMFDAKRLGHRELQSVKKFYSTSGQLP